MWSRFLYPFALTVGAGFGLCLAVVLLADPLGVSPVAVARKPGFAFDDPRFFAPQLLADERFDSYLIGTSTIHSVDPRWAEEAFGGHFAIVALQGGTPYELSTVVSRLEGKHNLRRVIFGLDATTWCKPQVPRRYRKGAIFPDWLYDEHRLNDFSALLNPQIERFALGQIAIDLGSEPTVPANGYRNHLSDATWNAKRASEKIYGSEEPLAVAEQGSGSTVEMTPATYPALQLLQQAVRRLPEGTLTIAIMPFHATVRQGSANEQRKLADCKQSIVTLLGERHAHVVDFNIDSAWTTNDQSYWDRSHFRVGLARSLILRLKEAIERRRDAEDGIYQYLSTPRNTNP